MLGRDFQDVTSVRKRKNYGFPNTIEIIWRGKKEFFTSFLSRDDAYRLIIMAWHQSSGYAKLFGAPVGEAGNTLRTSHRFRNRLRGSLSPQPSATETTVGQSQVSSSGPSATPQLRRIPDEEGSYSSDASVPPSIQVSFLVRSSLLGPPGLGWVSCCWCKTSSSWCCL